MMNIKGILMNIFNEADLKILKIQSRHEEKMSLFTKSV